jgi:transcriptional regulator with GAF, ATPase, and Fis domain
MLTGPANYVAIIDVAVLSAREPVLGRYRVLEVIGRGAFGRVLKVSDTETSEVRALKVAAGQGLGLADTGLADSMILDEFAQLARLRHPSLPRVFEVGRTAEPFDDIPAGRPFFVSEWIAGGRCDATSARHWDEPRAIWSLLADIAGALAVVHGAGLVHGDVAPANILLVGDSDEPRTTLVDLGMAARDGARGTPQYMAPEALAGHLEPRSDLYGLAATIVRLVTGRPPFEAPTLGELARQIVAPSTAPTLPNVPRPLADLVRRMMARDVDARPASALAVLDELDQLAPVIAPGLARRARPKVSAPPSPTAWPGAADVVDALAHGLGTPTVHIVTGPAQAGGRAIVDGAVRRWQLDEVARGHRAPRVIAGSLEHVAGVVGVGATPDAKGWLSNIAQQVARADALAVIDLGEDPRAATLVAALARIDKTRAIVVITDADVGSRDGVVVHRAPLLDVDGVLSLAATMLGREPPRAWAQALHAMSGGLALTTIDMMRSIASEKDPFAIDWTSRSTAGAADVRARQVQNVGDGARGVAAAVAALGNHARIDRVLAIVRASTGTSAPGLSDIVELERVGLIRRIGDEIHIDRATSTALDGELDLQRTFARAALADAALVANIPLDSLASLLLRAPIDDPLALFACDVAEQLLQRGRADLARDVASRALDVVPARAGLVAARAASALGAYRDVEVLARRARDAGADRVECVLIIARAAQKAGDLDAAEQTLADLHASDPAHADVAGVYARLLVTRSRFTDARRVAHAGGPLAGLRAEAAGLASFYLGDLDDADRSFAALEVGAAAVGDRATVGRALSLRGMVAQQRGQLGLASDRYREAARKLEEVGESHAAATAELNLGTALTERGRASEALPRLAAARRVFAELGATTEQVAADLNRGSALLSVGQADEAYVAAQDALALADGAPHLRAFALIVLGDALHQLGEELSAERAYRDALAIGVERGDAHAQVSAYVALAEAGHRIAADVDALCASDDDRDRWTIARGRFALHVVERKRRGTGGHPALRDSAPRAALRDTGAHPAFDVAASSRQSGAHAALRDAPSRAIGHDTSHPPLRDTGPHPAVRDTGNYPALRYSELEGPSDAELVGLARACADVATRAAESDRLERAFRACSVAAQLAQRGRDSGLARVLTERARAAHTALVAAAAPVFRAALEADPDFQRLPGERPAAIAQRDDSSALMRRLLTLSRRLNSEDSVERILDEVIDTAIELTAAERGFLLLRQGDGELAPVVSRNFAMSDLESNERSVSRSIAERAAQTGEPVVTVDAGVDERFAVAASVAALRLRSVLVVPLRQRGVITGCIYVDHRLRGGAFDDAAASVLGELADIAAIAIENARLTEELRGTTREVADLNRRLSAELADRDAELVRVKADLPSRDRLRNAYDNIVGKSPAMIRTLELVDRAAATSLPVVIIGESGTGKELIARALHDHGPRRDGAFVAINCSAVPEPLLESELFGHVRGAFTGADRDRRGLFEVADGGTLFLDEIADTSAGMQAKLLRVLQDGMIRRVGDSKQRKVDVRIVTASQRSLAELAAAGTFREDLRFRLEVISVVVPPLRERDGDVPLLVEKLLAQMCRGRTQPKLTRAAMRALGQHRWPGNVRELENALARGVAMGGDMIDVGDLPEAVVAAAARPEPQRAPVGDDLRLKPALTATEQAYISAAMSRAKGNQTVAARLLGLSRFGLQKKLRRLSGEESDDGDD